MAAPEADPAAGGSRRVRTCPCCGESIQRVRRRLLDRVISLWKPVVRLRCDAPACGWEGRVARAEWRADGREGAEYRPHYMLDPALGSPPGAAQPPAQAASGH
jgi:hypothetical protein